ncbi:MAG: VCBS repeat-containing protein, partial [Planctomycetota bacterium]
MRNHFRQIQNLVAGPDDDGDEVLDLYVLSVMSQTQSDLANTPHLFIDILSGASGKKLRTVGATLPETSETLDIATPFFWGQANDGSPQIVVSTLRASIVGRRGWTAMLSTGTGEITHYCSQLERTTPIDFRGDGRPGLLTIQPLDTNDLSGAAQMILVPPTSGESSHLIGKRYAAVEDLDGDGVRDLLTDERASVLHAISGRDGRQIWQSSVESSNGKAIAGNGDFNGDGVDDHCSWRTYIGLGGTTQLVLTGISGRTGTSLWTTQFPVSNRGSHLHAVCSDIDRDGTNELLLTVYDQVGGNNRAVRLHCLHTMNGRKKWDSLASADGNSSLFSSDKIDQWPIHLLDLSGDGNQEVVIPLQDIPGEPLAAVWDASGNPLPQTPLGDYSIVPTQRPWLSRVLSMRQTQTGKPTLRHQFVVPDFELNAATGVSRVSCNWFDISSGRHISHWSADGRLNDYRPINDFAPGIAQGTPFLIRAGDVDYTGLCIMDRRAGGVQN